MGDKEKGELKKFKYVAVDINKNKTTGIMLAADESDLERLLFEANLYLVSCKVQNKDPIAFFILSGNVKASDITNFAHEFAVMIAAGITIIDALDTLRNQSYCALLRRTLNMVYNDVRSGLLLSEAFAKHKEIFPELFISMTYIGEMSGSLDTVLSELAEYYEKDNQIKRKAKSALVYPSILLFITFTVVILLVIVIIPTFKSTLEQLDVEMPKLTLTILSISDFVVANWAMMLLVFALLVFFFVLLFRVEEVKYIWDAFKANAPVINKVTEALVSSRFARGFGTLIASGVGVVRSLEIMSELLGNRYYKKKFLKACTDIKEGSNLSDAFKAHKVFPPILIQMISVGEKTGSLESVLRRTTSYFDDRAEAALMRMTSLLEPIAICIMGIIIAVIMLSVFAPLLSVMNTLGG